MANDDLILTTMRFIPQHEVVQKYGAILPDNLTNQAMKESKEYKTYYSLATGKVIPKPKYVRRSTRTKTDQAPKASLGKRLKITAKVAKSGKKKIPAQGLETLSEIALSEDEQMKIAIERSKTQLYNSHVSGSGTYEGTGVIPEVPDVLTYGYEDEQIYWKSSDDKDDDEVSESKDDDDNANNEDDDGQDDVNDQTESDNDGDDFVYPKFTTHDKEERQDEEDKEEEAYDEVTHGVNVEGEELNKEETNEEEEVNELYRDVNVNLEGRDTEMTDAPQTNVQGTQVTEDTHVIITAVTPEVQHQSSSVSSGFISNMLNPNPNTGIESIVNLNTESTSMVDVPVTTNVEMPPSSVTTLPPPPIPLFQPQQQTPVPSPAIVLSTSLQNLPTFGSLFKFEDRVKALEDDFSEFKQTNEFATAVSSIPNIVDTYLANKMNEAKIIKEQVKVQVKEQVSKILLKIEKFVNDQLKAEVLNRSSNEAKTSHAITANLSKLELKKILIDKMENNKSIDRSLQQKTLYKALVDAYESNKDILETYGDTVTFKRHRDDKDEDEEPSAGSNQGVQISSKSTGKSAQAEEPIHAEQDLEKPTHQEFDTGFTEDQLVDETTQHPDWFQKPTKPPTPNSDWNKTLHPKHGPVQPWIRTLARNEDPRESFNELMDTPLNFLAFVSNRLKVDTLTPELLAGPTYELIKDQLDWNNPEGQQYPHDLRKPLPLIPNSRVNRESTRDVYSKHRILAITKLKIVEWHNYKHLDCITVHRDDDKLYTFKEGDYNRLRLQDIKDMLLLLRIRMEYLPQTVWRNVDRERAGAMVQAIDR
ncbi:hypothetical protein Tco_1170784 [Tanacetum coccineum]